MITANLDYSGSEGIWSVYIGPKPMPGMNVLNVGRCIKRLVEWCFDNCLKVRLSPTAGLVMSLEVDYWMRSETIAAIDGINPFAITRSS